MSGGPTSAAGWSTRLAPLRRPENVFVRPDDPRLGEILVPFSGDAAALIPGRAVLIGFPQDEGVRRNRGRPGAARAPHDVRHALSLLTSWDGASDTDLSLLPPLDAGDVRIQGTLEDTQAALGEVVAGVLASGAVPVILGGGHETAYGHYLGYATGRRPVAVVNVDAHLDVRPCAGGHGHSGTPFRQAMEHADFPLRGDRYVCLGAQPHSCAREHVRFVRERGGAVVWAEAVRGRLGEEFAAQRDRLAATGCQVYVTVDADAVSGAEVPGVSAPNALGLAGAEVAELAYLAGISPAVSSFDLVEVNPQQDPSGQSARWAAVVVWRFLVGLARRASHRAP